jgi:hypothetical protein
MNLLNLELPVNLSQYRKLIDLFKRVGLSSDWYRWLDEYHEKKIPAKSLVSGLLKGDPRRTFNHNTHPAAQALQIVTGFVFHPNFQGNLDALVSPDSPMSFDNVSKLLCSRYLEALDRDMVLAFFERGFVREDPCFEATVDHLLTFQLVDNRSVIIAPPPPNWHPLASDADNADALVEWLERVYLEKYVQRERIPVAPNDYKRLEELLEDHRFRAYLVKNRGVAFSDLKDKCPDRPGVHELLQGAIQRIWS